MMDVEERKEFEAFMDLAEDNIRSEWEEEFIESLREQALNPFWSPTDRQWEKLEEIAASAPPF